MQSFLKSKLNQVELSRQAALQFLLYFLHISCHRFITTILYWILCNIILNSLENTMLINSVIHNQHSRSWPSHRMREVDLGTGRALLIKEHGEFSAIGHKCPHYGAPLVKGEPLCPCYPDGVAVLIRERDLSFADFSPVEVTFAVYYISHFPSQSVLNIHPVLWYCVQIIFTGIFIFTLLTFFPNSYLYIFCTH